MPRPYLFWLAATLLISACGKSTPKPDPTAVGQADTAVTTPKPAPIKSPVAAAQTALTEVVAGPGAGAASKANAQADSLEAWAKANSAHADADDALALAATYRVVGAAIALSNAAESASVVPKLNAALAYANGKDGQVTSQIAAAANAILRAVPGAPPSRGALKSATALAHSDGPLGAAVRVAWLSRLGETFTALGAAPPHQDFAVLLDQVGPMLCPGCGDADEVTRDQVSIFLLKAMNAGGVVCDAAIAGAAAANTPIERAALLAACPLTGVAGRGEGALGVGGNALTLGAANLALSLAAAPEPQAPLAAWVQTHSDKALEAMSGRYPLPFSVVVGSRQRRDADADERNSADPDDATIVAIDGLGGATGLSVAAPALGVFVVGIDGIRGGVRPTVQLQDGKLVSISKASGADLDAPPVMNLDAVTGRAGTDRAERDADGAVEALKTLGQRVAAAASNVITPGEASPLIAHMIVDADAPSAAVVALIDSLKAAGYAHTRFARTAAMARVLPMVTRSSPTEGGPAAKYELPTRVVVGAESVDVWGPASPVKGDDAPTTAAAKLPASAKPGYKGKTLVRLRIRTPTDDRGALSADTLRLVADAVNYWQRSSGAGPIIHVIAGEGSVAADILRVARGFQEAEGRSLADVIKGGSVWPGAACEDPKATCASGVAVAFSSLPIPSSRGLSDTPREAKKAPKKPKVAPPSPEFCNKRDIKVRMKKRARDFRYCYESQLRMDPSLKGRVVTSFAINLDGTTSQVKISKSDMPSAKVKKCVTKRIQKMTFAKPDGGRCLVRWPFVFK